MGLPLKEKWRKENDECRKQAKKLGNFQTSILPLTYFFVLFLFLLSWQGNVVILNVTMDVRITKSDVYFVYVYDLIQRRRCPRNELR